MRTNDAQYRPPQHDLANLLFGTYRHRVLSLLFLRPGDRFHVRMIARLTGIPAGSLHRELRLLADAGLLFAERVGNQMHYRANEASPVYHELVAVLDKTSPAPPTLQQDAAEYTVHRGQSLPPVAAGKLAALCRRYRVTKMSLFGSAARGELRPESDVDLLVQFAPRSKSTLFDQVRLQEELSPLFDNRRVHIADPEILENPYRRKTIMRDLKTLYEA